MAFRKRFTAKSFIKGRRGDGSADVKKPNTSPISTLTPVPKKIGTPVKSMSDLFKGKKPPKTPEPKEKFNSRDYVSFERLFRNAVRSDSKYVHHVTVTSLKKFPKHTGIVGYESKTVTIDEQKRPRRYNHFFIAQDGKPVTQSKAIKFSCQCLRFKFFYEYALHKKHAADIIYSNGEPPTINNPHGYLAYCKHGIAVATAIIKRERK